MILTLMEMAQKGQETSLFTRIAKNEHMDVQLLTERVAMGQIVIHYNNHHQPKKSQGFGLGLSTKVSASLGLDADEDRLADELFKAAEAIRTGTQGSIPLIASTSVNSILFFSSTQIIFNIS